VPVVDGVTFGIGAGETLAVVGESGCGKSTLALSIARLLPKASFRIAAGTVDFLGSDVVRMPEDKVRQLRGRDLSMIFQDPLASLNPVETIGTQLVEVLQQHEPLSRAEAKHRAIRLLKQVRMPDAERRLSEYPHRLSGGMCQRVMIAMALACGPKLIIADEPTTALDVTIQAQIMALLRQIQEDSGTAILLITHNLALVANNAHRVLVMYAGRIVESGAVRDVFSKPLHPYTRGLLAATPVLPQESIAVPNRMNEIAGTVPAPGKLPAGCAFQDRCPRVQKACYESAPEAMRITAGSTHTVACHAVLKELT
jgi:oligopeptide/dipeptide ABC transporter ATP-binding protein